MININPTTIPQIDKAFKDLCDIIVKTTEEIVPKRKIGLLINFVPIYF
jgi:hypothetical protein